MITVEKARDRLHRKISKIGDEALPDLLSIAGAENGASARSHPVIEGFEARVTKAFQRGFRRMAKAAVTEECAVAKSAARTARKKEIAMDMMAVARRIAGEGSRACPSVTRAMLYSELVKRADATRRADETPEGAFARFATTDADGRALFSAYKIASGEDYQPGPSADRGLLGPRREERPLPPPNAAHDALMRKAEALVANVAKSGAGKRITLEAAYEKVLSDPANRALAQAAMRPASMQGAPSVDEDEDDDNSSASYEDDGGNAAHNASSAVISGVSTDQDKTARPASATRTFGFGGRKAKIAARVQKFLTMCPNASDDEALEYALSRKSARKGVDARLKAS